MFVLGEPYKKETIHQYHVVYQNSLHASFKQQSHVEIYLVVIGKKFSHLKNTFCLILRAHSIVITLHQNDFVVKL